MFENDVSLNFDGWTLFLDRDGVINYEISNNYVKNWDEFQFYDTSLEALLILNNLFENIVVVTNQRGVGLGIQSMDSLRQIHRNMLEQISAFGGRIDAVFSAIETDDNVPNRKPQTGMAAQALSMFPKIDFGRSIMVGNSFSDLVFGRNLGMINVFITSTNPNPSSDISNLSDFVYPNLLEFAKEFFLFSLQVFWAGNKRSHKLLYLNHIDTGFETILLSLKATEKKVFTDYELSNLPYTDDYMPNQDYWALKEKSAFNFMDYLDNKRTPLHILVVGCDGGWFANMIAGSSLYNVTAIDTINTELIQAARVFKRNNLQFIYGDIMNIDTMFQYQFDIIVLNNSVQFFPNINSLNDKLRSFLKPKGEIHIFDSPIYSKSDILKHQKDKTFYFRKKNCPLLSKYFFFHPIEIMREYQILYKPVAAWKRKLFYKDTPEFPWFRYVKI